MGRMRKKATMGTTKIGMMRCHSSSTIYMVAKYQILQILTQGVENWLKRRRLWPGELSEIAPPVNVAQYCPAHFNL